MVVTNMVVANSHSNGADHSRQSVEGNKSNQAATARKRALRELQNDAGYVEDLPAMGRRRSRAPKNVLFSDLQAISMLKSAPRKSASIVSPAHSTLSYEDNSAVAALGVVPTCPDARVPKKKLQDDRGFVASAPAQAKRARVPAAALPSAPLSALPSGQSSQRGAPIKSVVKSHPLPPQLPIKQQRAKQPPQQQPQHQSKQPGKQPVALGLPPCHSKQHQGAAVGSKKAATHTSKHAGASSAAGAGASSAAAAPFSQPVFQQEPLEWCGVWSTASAPYYNTEQANEGSGSVTKGFCLNPSSSVAAAAAAGGPAGAGGSKFSMWQCHAGEQAAPDMKAVPQAERAESAAHKPCCMCDKSDFPSSLLTCTTDGCRGTIHKFCCEEPDDACGDGCPEGKWKCFACTEED